MLRRVSFLAALRAGVLGVALDVPSSYEVVNDDASTGNVVDRENAVVWYFFSAPMLELDLEQLESQRRDVHSYVHHIGDVLLACERVTVGDAPALSILHRTAEDGVVGHLLVPTGAGLFEARWLAKGDATGARARSAERWIREGAGLRVVAPARPVLRSETVLKDLRCALVPPPRFARQAANKRFALFCRVSIATTDGLQYFSIPRRRGADVAELLDDRTHELIRADKMLVTTKEARPAPPGAEACIVADAEHATATRRFISVGVREAPGSAAILTIICTPSDPIQDLVDELAVAARTYRVVKPWWQVW